MIKVNIHEAKTHLSRYLAMLSNGQSVLLCKRNRPIAEIRPLPATRQGKRPVGLAKGAFKVPREFFEPLPDEMLKRFTGELP
jgi:antitoxin (DNA-binding transcriptional repressor) of toxin-antitoxin stability system